MSQPTLKARTHKKFMGQRSLYALLFVVCPSNTDLHCCCILKRASPIVKYQKLKGTIGASGTTDRETIPHQRMRANTSSRPRLVALPGGRSAPTTPVPSYKHPSQRSVRAPQRRPWGQYILQTVTAAAILLTLGVAGFIGWNLWHQHGQVASGPASITPPANPVTEPIPAAKRFVFLRNEVLWSGPTDGSTQVVQLTPGNISVAKNWTVRPAVPGPDDGDLLAYI